MNHVSEHVLDRIASGLPPVPPEAAHVEGCEHCRARLAEIRREAEAAARMPAFGDGLAAVRRVQAESPNEAAQARPAAPWPWLIAGLGAAAAILLVALVRLVPGSDPDVRTKGAAAVNLVAEGLDQPLTGPLTAGASVQLVLNPALADERQALVILVNQAGAATVLWPPRAEASGTFSGGLPLTPGFRVTAGDFLLLAVFGVEPFEAGPVLEAASQAARRCPGPLDASCVPVESLPGAGGRARAAFRVQSP